jgi:hypothetical protein
LPITCTFKLNNKPMSILHCDGVGDFEAFSGLGISKNNPDHVGLKDVGPLPPGRYYIVDRGSGGMFTRAADFVTDMANDSDRRGWYALYRDDDEIDDQTIVNGVMRGLFRLHPRGGRNLSKGCITLADPVAFEKLRSRLYSSPRLIVPGGKGLAYGTLDVR